MTLLKHPLVLSHPSGRRPRSIFSVSDANQDNQGWLRLAAPQKSVLVNAAVCAPTGTAAPVAALFPEAIAAPA